MASKRKGSRPAKLLCPWRTKTSMWYVKQLLYEYGKASGQLINYETSELAVSKNISSQLKEEIVSLLGFKIVPIHAKYLDLPLVLKRKRTETFQALLDKIWGRIHGWKSSHLSIGGRHVLITSVLNAIPMYWLSCFALPERIISNIHTAINNFWWNQTRDKKSVHWIRSETLRKHKEEGGLGFVNFKWLNLAFLSKQGWRIAQNSHLLVSRLFKAKYFPNSSILDASLHRRPSHVWRSMYSSLPIINYGCSRVPNSDVFCWDKNSSGCLDIKSAYKVAELLYNNSHCHEGEQSNDSKLRKFWKQLWKLPIPRKIKILHGEDI
ncbi:hypothetical protein QQ045_027642 [Rhodiola kirilowii]